VWELSNVDLIHGLEVYGHEMILYFKAMLFRIAGCAERSFPFNIPKAAMRLPIFRARTAILVLTGTVAAGSAIVPATSAFAARVSYVAPADNAALTHKLPGIGIGIGTGSVNRPSHGFRTASTEPLAVHLNCTTWWGTYLYKCTAYASGGSGAGYAFYWDNAEELTDEGGWSTAVACEIGFGASYFPVGVTVVDSNYNMALNAEYVQCY
jgi:hypothetical protein